MMTRLRATAQRRLEQTAYHEAGHAVICYNLGIRMQSVTIVPTDDNLGHVKTAPPPKWLHPDIETDSKTVSRLTREILVDLAGDAGSGNLDSLVGDRERHAQQGREREREGWRRETAARRELRGGGTTTRRAVEGAVRATGSTRQIGALRA